jgi:hypothetical protein
MVLASFRGICGGQEIARHSRRFARHVRLRISPQARIVQTRRVPNFYHERMCPANCRFDLSLLSFKTDCFLQAMQCYKMTLTRVLCQCRSNREAASLQCRCVRVSILFMFWRESGLLFFSVRFRNAETHQFSVSSYAKSVKSY